jgi:hypothetical protein
MWGVLGWLAALLLTSLVIGPESATAVTRKYNFYCSYDNGSGDRYSGYVYADTSKGYYVGYTKSFTDENGERGHYYINGIESGTGTNGQVYVNTYFDHEVGNTFTPVSSGTAVGTNYLGSEHDYIIQGSIPEFYFGGGYNEADLGNYSRYDYYFCYTDGSGDNYKGYVYAPTGMVRPGQWISEQPTNLQAWGFTSMDGLYYIDKVTNGYSSNYDKQSVVTSYYDNDFAHASLGVNPGDGTGQPENLHVYDRTRNWEAGYAISGANYGYFSSYVEADVWR